MKTITNHLKNRAMKVLATAAFVALFAPQANAALLYENPVQLGQELLPSGYRLQEGGSSVFNTINNSVFVATEFSLTGTNNVNAVSFSAAVYNDASASVPTGVDWKVYNDGGAIPGSLLASGNNSSYTLGSALAGNSFNHFEYTLSIPDLALNSGTYWLAFRLLSTDSNIFWSRGHNLASNATSSDGGSTWPTLNSGGQGNAIAVYGNAGISAVPLPPSALLFGTALLGLAGLRRRKRRTSPQGDLMSNLQA